MGGGFKGTLLFKDSPETTDLTEEGRRMGTLRDKATLPSLVSPIVPLLWKKEKKKLSHIMHSKFIKHSQILPWIIVHAKLLQLCLTLCDPIDWNPPGSSNHDILQARIPQWVTMPYSRGSSWPMDRTRIYFVSCTGIQHHNMKFV